MFIDINIIAILNIHGVDYGCIIIGINKSETINLLENALNEKKVVHYKIIFLSWIKKMNKEIITLYYKIITFNIEIENCKI